MGKKIVSLISEGNVPPQEKQIYEFLWGLNIDKVLYEDAKILWSHRSRGLFLEKYPPLENKLCVSGGTGFDRHKLLKFIDKEEFLAKNNLKKYKNIIGISGWIFDYLFPPIWDRVEEIYIKIYGDRQIESWREDLLFVRDIYKRLIEENKDILFILRFHLATINIEKSEFFGVDNYENVYISYNPYISQVGIKVRQDFISDLISASDLWIGYDSTTLLEAWLLGETTFLINPTKSNFIRDDIYKGSPIAKNYDDVQKLINEFFKTGKINEFDTLKDSRKKIIKDVTEYGDGKNHIRAAEIIYKIFSEKNKRTERIKYNNFPWVATLKQSLSFELDKFFKRRNYDTDSEIKYYESLYLPVIKKEISENGK